jgi:hypothetical protein
MLELELIFEPFFAPFFDPFAKSPHSEKVPGKITLSIP